MVANIERPSLFKISGSAPAQVFSCEICKISKNNFSYRTPQVAASEQRKVLLFDYLPKVLKEGLTSAPPRNKFHKL